MSTFKNINYIRYGNENKNTVVLLHGWGQNIEMMKPIGNRIDNDVIIIDLPGFGKSAEPEYAYTVYDYAALVHELLESLNVENPIMIGHSFGGKITLIYASMYNVNKIILLASPFRVQKQNTSLKSKVLKTLKKVPVLKRLENVVKKHVGSTDYRNASPMMRDILVKTVNLDITEDVKKIKCPSLMIWGTLDTAVPIEDAYYLEKLIKDSGVVAYEGCSHYAYLERLEQTIRVINSFIN